jgi:hypothetical protein
VEVVEVQPFGEGLHRIRTGINECDVIKSTTVTDVFFVFLESSQDIDFNISTILA